MRPKQDILDAAIEEVRTCFELLEDSDDYEAVFIGDDGNPETNQAPQQNPDGSYTYSVRVTYKGGSPGDYDVEVYDNQISADCWRSPNGDCFGLEIHNGEGFIIDPYDYYGGPNNNS